MPVHDAARGFDSAAAGYERARPEYPRAAVDAAFAALRLREGSRLVDLGAGTGKFSRLAASRGATVLALDTSDAMIRRAAGERILAVRAAAEAIPSGDGAFDGAAAASAFHWFDGPRALAEIHRVLRPGARLVLVWNVRDDAVPWVARLSAVVNRSEGAAPRYRLGRWRAAFDATGLFGPLEEAHFRHVHALSPEGVVERIASVSFVAAMAEEERQAVLRDVRALLATHPDTAGRREVGIPYLTDLYWCERRGR